MKDTTYCYTFFKIISR